MKYMKYIKNERAYTLVELIVTISIMGLIMAIAAINVTSMVDKNKRMAYINDALKMVKLAQYEFAKDPSIHPSEGQCILYKLQDLDRSEFQDSPNEEGKYLEDVSYVKVSYNKTSEIYVYSVQLVEEYKIDNNTYYRGIGERDSSLLSQNNSKIKYVGEATTNKDIFNKPSHCT